MLKLMIDLHSSRVLHIQDPQTTYCTIKTGIATVLLYSCSLFVSQALPLQSQTFFLEQDLLHRYSSYISPGSFMVVL